MKPGQITHTLAALLSSVTSLFAHGAVTKAEPTKVKLSKKSETKSEQSGVGVESLAFAPSHLRSAPPSPGDSFPWKHQIVTTVFWIGEKPTENNPVPNRSSSWDKDWTKNYGAGLDVSPAVRDYLGLNETDVTDWQFVEFKDVPHGPWSKLGDNNTFVINDRKAETQLARAKSSGTSGSTTAPE